MMIFLCSLLERARSYQLKYLVMKERETDILASAAATLGVMLTETARKLFGIYYEELTMWNERINLVSIKSPQDIWIKHFIDSLTVIPYLTEPECKLLDIGSGAGFPGIPLKIAVPSLTVYLLEASRKRVSFLKHICRLLKLEGIHVIHKRVEEAALEDAYIGTFDMVISRASFKLPELLHISAPFLKREGTLFAMKGKDITREMEDSVEAAKVTNMIFYTSNDLNLPQTNDNRKIIIYKKYLQ
jgi:16S rRNA (guanine527-N7)-methyltransferase